MNPEFYFDDHPWDYAVGKIKSDSIGKLVAASVHEMCVTAKLDNRLAHWQNEFGVLLGEASSVDVQGSTLVKSALLRYESEAIVRLFLEGGATVDSIRSFEFVGSRGLLVWKPDVHPLSIHQFGSDSNVLYEHPYPATFRVPKKSKRQ